MEENEMSQAPAGNVIQMQLVITAEATVTKAADRKKTEEESVS